MAVGERQGAPFQLSFNGWLRVDFQGARLTGGLLLVRELDELELTRFRRGHWVISSSLFPNTLYETGSTPVAERARL